VFGTRMFESYINKLRLLRCHATDLKARDFRHRQTVWDPQSKLGACSGWTLWVTGSDSDASAIAWPWGFIEHGVPAIDPMQIQSNLLLLDAAGRPVPGHQALGVLVSVVNCLEWHLHAREACAKH